MKQRKIYFPTLLCLSALLAAACAEPRTQPIDSPDQPSSGGDEAYVNEPIQPIPLHLELSEEKIALGDKLFHEPLLSANNQISCATCHNLALAGTDRKARSHGIDQALTDFNSPTVFNSGFNFTQFWDGRVQTLEDQIEETTHSIIEMGSSWKDILEKLEKAGYPVAFEEVYQDGLTKENVKDAIAEFERSLYTPNAPFDRYLRGDEGAIDAEEKEGYQLFKTYGCITCHQGVGVGGNIFETFGVLGNPFQDHSEPRKADLGRYNITGEELDRYVFKVPSLRNVAITPPYFHDGSVRELSEAVMIMSRYQLGRRLTDREIELIVKFLGTLTGEYKGVPLDESSG